MARKVALGLSEAKRFVIVREQYSPTYIGSLNFQWVFRNVFSPLAVLPTGVGATVGSWVLNGNEFVDPLVKVKLRISADWGLLAGNAALDDIYIYSYVVASNDEFLNTVVPALYPSQGSSTDPGWFQVGNRINPTLNSNNVKIIKRVKMRLSPSGNPVSYTNGDVIVGKTQRTMSYSFRLKRKMTFEDDPANMVFTTGTQFLNRRSGTGATTRGWNYYFLNGFMSNSSIPTAARPIIEQDSFVYFKDP